MQRLHARKLARSGLFIATVAAQAAFASVAHADLSCKTVRQAKIDEVIQEESARPNVTITDEGNIVRVVYMDEKPAEQQLDRIVTLYTKAGHPNHPTVVSRKMLESRRFYITFNKGWTVGAPAECATMLKQLVADEGSNDDDDVSMVEK